MSNLKSFYLGFIERSGFHILISTTLARLLSFFASWVALKLIPNFELGLVIYALNIITLIIPISGFGAYQGLLRYGALLKTDTEKNQLFSYVLIKGGLLSLVLIAIISLSSSLFTYNILESRIYLILISLSIFTHFLMESLKIQFRVLHQNKNFAKAEIIFNIILLILVSFGSYFFKENGYIFALIASPLITFFIFLPKIKFSFYLPNHFKKPSLEFWKYSFYTGLSNVAGQLLFVLDIILIGTLLKDPEMVTIYKYLSLIPFSLLFLPRAILTTDFVMLTKRHADKLYIKKYIKNYSYLFLLISIILILLTFMFSELILSFFDKEFILHKLEFRILIIGVSSILIFRGLFGNLLSTIGKAYINYWIALTGLLINLFSNYILIPKYGILGAAVTSAGIMWITSLLSVYFYFYFYNKIEATDSTN